MPPRKHGPTPKPEKELRNQRVVAHFTADEYAKLTALAGSAVPRRIAAHVRDSALKKSSQVAPEINREAWQKLAHPLANLNQIAHKLNSGNSYNDMDRIDIMKLIVLIKELRGKLL